jgi:two-component system NtrC family sensor kinase
MDADRRQVERSWELQKSFHELTARDREMLARFRGHVEPRLAAVAARLLDHLVDAQLIVPTKVGGTLAQSFASRLEAAAQGLDDLDNFSAALHHAEQLDRAGLAPHYFVACHARALELVASEATRGWPGDPLELPAYMSAFSRSLFRDAAAGSEAYARAAAARFADGYQETINVRVGFEDLLTVAADLAKEQSVTGVLSRLGKEVRKLGRAEASFVWIRPEGTADLVPVVVEGMPDSAIAGLHFKSGVGFVGEAASTGDLIEGDLATDRRVAGRDFVLQHGLRQGIAVPMVSGGSVRGVLGVARRQPKPFSELERKILSMLAAFAGDSLALAVLHEKAAADRERLARLHEVARELASTSDLPRTLQKICEAGKSLSGVDVVILWMLDGERREFTPTAWVGHSDETARALRIPADKGIPGEVVRTRGPVTGDLASDPRVHAGELKRSGLRRFTAVPIFQRDRVRGVLGLSSREERALPPETLEVIVTLAANAGTAIETVERFLDATRARNEWESTFNSIQDLVVVVDPEGRVIRANRAMLSKASTGAEEAAGRPWHALLGLASPVPADLAALLKAGTRHGGEVQAMNRVYQLDATPVRAGLEAGGGVLVLRDVTERKRLEQQLVQAEKLTSIGQLVSGVAHELNNPLSSVLGFAELAEKDAAASEEAKGYLKIVREEAQRAVKIVKNLLTFARQHKPERTKTALHELIDRVAELMSYEVRTHRVKLVRDYDPALPSLMIDPHQFQQVLFNLIQNALHALEEKGGGTIRLRTKGWGGLVTLSVIDDGPGIRPELLGKIFDPFFTTKPVGKGTGLGLAVCFGIVHEHGGTIRAESEAGRGTAFHVELPVTAEGEASKKSSSSKLMAPRHLKILVADDEPSVLEFVRRVLATDNVVVGAADGREAVELLRRERFDLVISDMRMPGLDGKELYRIIVRELPALADRVIFTTGDVLSSETNEFLKDFGLPTLEKPFSSKDLYAKVLKLLNPA